MLHCVVEFCAAVLYVVMYSGMLLCAVVTCYLELLHAVQCCYMLHSVVEICAAVLNFVMCFCMWCSLVTCSLGLLHAV